VYTTDERGRILTETREDEEGNVTGELRNFWSDDRLSRIVWNAGGEERITEYVYDQDGDRIEEKNYRNGALERLVRVQGDREDEELYMNGEPILRTRWEGGRKVYEEHIRPGGPRRRGNP
jgi:antitoxin component YwqK of YwqJK toxin-antitoxin module